MRVLLIDDHALFRIGLQELLERRGIEVVDAIGDCDQGLCRVTETLPNVVLLDLRMPGVGGLEALRRLRAARQTMPVVMLTTSDDERDLLAALRTGAQGYLLKDMEPDELIRALEEIVAGQTVVAKELTGALVKVVIKGDPAAGGSGPTFSGLTPREHQILCRLAEGRSNKAIARALGISDGTVKLHVKAILRKLGVPSTRGWRRRSSPSRKTSASAVTGGRRLRDNHAGQALHFPFHLCEPGGDALPIAGPGGILQRLEAGVEGGYAAIAGAAAQAMGGRGQ